MLEVRAAQTSSGDAREAAAAAGSSPPPSLDVAGLPCCQKVPRRTVMAKPAAAEVEEEEVEGDSTSSSRAWAFLLAKFLFSKDSDVVVDERTLPPTNASASTSAAFASASASAARLLCFVSLASRRRRAKVESSSLLRTATTDVSPGSTG